MFLFIFFDFLGFYASVLDQINENKTNNNNNNTKLFVCFLMFEQFFFFRFVWSVLIYASIKMFCYRNTIRILLWIY